MPISLKIFLTALANAGITLSGGLGEQLLSPVAIGTFLGLLIGGSSGYLLLRYAEPVEG